MSALVAIDGREVRGPLELDCDIVIVGSGPAGAAVARVLARAGASVVVVEEGRQHLPGEFTAPAFDVHVAIWRDFGASLLMGPSPMPLLQGRAVGGTSVINGAISWRLPRDVWEGWAATDPALREALPFEAIEAATDEVIADLGIAPTEDTIAGPKNLLMARGAEALGLEHRPISRNVRGCEGLGRCLQGCPRGHKQSMDLTYLPDAVAAGARIAASARVTRILVERQLATGVEAATGGGGRLRVRAKSGVVLAASAIQTPALLLANRITQGPVGEGLQGHPGASVGGHFDEPVRMWTGATQGHEVIGLRREGIKFEALGFDMTIAATRAFGVGRDLAREVRELAHFVDWGAAIKAEARGRVRPGRRRARVSGYALTRADLGRMRRGIRVLGEMLFAAGAREVIPGVHGWHDRVEDRALMARFEDEAPWDPRCYTAGVSHLFGTCRLGSDPAQSVVRPDFRHHAVDRLWVADSSVFPTNTGVNPQTSILALATLCGKGIARAPRER